MASGTPVRGRGARQHLLSRSPTPPTASPTRCSNPITRSTPQYPVDPDRWRIFEGTYDVSLRASISPNPYPGIGEVTIEDGGRLLLELWIPNSGWYEAWILDHVGLDVFYVDVDGDDLYDLDLSFVTSDGTPERVRWMRMRPVVGNLQVAPRGGRRLAP